jgi:hypothetical protein
MMYYLSTLRTEFGFAASGYRHGPRQVHITDIYVPAQTVSEVYWEQTPVNGIDDVFLHFKDAPTRQVGWGHSHGDLGAFHSTTDTNTTRTLATTLQLPIASLTISRDDTKQFDGKVVIKNRGGNSVITNARVILPFDPKAVEIRRLNEYGRYEVPISNTITSGDGSIRDIIGQIKTLLSAAENQLGQSDDLIALQESGTEGNSVLEGW